MQYKYDLVTRILHWSIALGILIMISLGLSFDFLSSSQFKIAIFIHKSLAMTLLIMMVVRVFWRLTYRRAPPYPHDLKKWQLSAAHTAHILLYLTIFIMLFSGWLMSSWAGYPVPFWGLANLALPLAHNTHYASIASTVHSTCAWFIITLIVLHITAVLWHTFVRRDNILTRML